MTTPPASRRFDLDWLRIGAFGLLILYHVGMFYVTWDWHVKSADASSFAEPAMLLVNPWRLGLLFFISGVATRFMTDRIGAGAFARSRFARLGAPLLFGILIIVPPQSYLELMEAGIALSPADFYQKYLTFYGGWCDADGCLIVPTYNHLWFVAYLLAYSLGLAALAPLLSRLPRLRLPAWLFLVGPFLYLWLCRVVLLPLFGETHAFVDDWYLHAVYLFLFGLGVAVAKSDAPFQVAARWRWPAALTATVAWAMPLAAYGGTIPLDAWPLRAGLHEVQAWAAIIALLGFARRHLAAADGPVRRWLTRAVFPFYIIHQTAIVVIGHALDPSPLPVGAEATLLVLATAARCVAFAWIGERAGPLRIWFGLSPPSPPSGGRPRAASGPTA